ncbi:hypothetical protein GCM10010250_21760 [Streptomyces althioticus]|uniref:hypothetical protein n=1 Tax=Streptomyces althioticus TaxID=83380 RepID=UPI0018749F7A|nr:hypothetical protein GCM10010250_21760 [Streptomyces althioticus]
MATTHFDGFLTDGTNGVYYNARLADGQVIAVKAQPGTDTVDVYLPDAIPTPDGDAWELEDSWEAHLTAGDDPVEGRYFYDVPADDVRALIEEHGGEHTNQGR